VEPELAEPRPLLELLESSDPELDELEPEPLELEPELLPEPELPEPEPLEPESLEPESSEPVELAVVPVPPESGCRADTMAAERPVPPMPRTAVAIAAAPARRNQRPRADRAAAGAPARMAWDSSNASVVTMAVSLAGGSSAALQENVKRPSSSAESSLRALLRMRRDR
jgi:hypothetical protein